MPQFRRLYIGFQNGSVGFNFNRINVNDFYISMTNKELIVRTDKIFHIPLTSILYWTESPVD